jgi:hypothetical protein
MDGKTSRPGDRPMESTQLVPPETNVTQHAQTNCRHVRDRSNGNRSCGDRIKAERQLAVCLDLITPPNRETQAHFQHCPETG